MTCEELLKKRKEDAEKLLKEKALWTMAFCGKTRVFLLFLFHVGKTQHGDVDSS